jgi:hypothetical protein
LSKLWKVISFTPTADTLHVQVPVGRIERVKKHSTFILTLLSFLRSSRPTNKRGEIFKTNGLSRFLHMTYSVYFSTSCVLQLTTIFYGLWQCNKLERHWILGRNLPTTK